MNLFLGGAISERICQSSITDNAENYFSEISFFLFRNTLCYENIKIPYQNSLHYGEARTFRALLCVRKQRKNIITKHLILGWATTAAAAAEEFPGNLHPTIPSHPGMKYPIQHPPHFDFSIIGPWALQDFREFVGFL